MALDEILKEHAAWLEKAAQQPIFQKVKDSELNFPQELRDRRAKEIVETIDALNRQRDTAVARFAEAIKGYEKELEALKTPADTAQPDKKPAKEPGTDTKSTGTAATAAAATTATRKSAAKSRKKDG